jgi:hypothetical protein
VTRVAAHCSIQAREAGPLELGAGRVPTQIQILDECPDLALDACVLPTSTALADIGTTLARQAKPPRHGVVTT